MQRRLLVGLHQAHAQRLSSDSQSLSDPLHNELVVSQLLICVRLFAPSKFKSFALKKLLLFELIQVVFSFRWLQ